MKNLKFLALTAIAPCVIFTSCKKDEATPKPVCKIITATSSSSSNSINLTYNEDGKLSKITQGTFERVYQYSGNTVTVLAKNAGVFDYKGIIDLNSNGMPSNVRTESDMTGTIWDNKEYAYSGTEVIKQTHTNSSSPTPSITTYTWADGNLTSQDDGSNTTTFEYYTDQASGDGDYMWYVNLVTYTDIYRNKNPLKSTLAGTSLTELTYDRDSDGKIIKMTVDFGGSSSTDITYQYQCD